MIVYPNNILSGATALTATNLASGTSLEPSYNNFFDYASIFDMPNTVVNIEYPFLLPAYTDTIIIYPAFAKTVLFGGSVLGSLSLRYRSLAISPWNELGPFPLQNHRLNIIHVPRFSMGYCELNISNGTESSSVVANLVLNYFYMGQKVELGNFISPPEMGRINTDSANETQTGQVYGIKGTSLQTFGCHFAHINNAQKIKQETYFNDVGLLTGHVIDPYPENYNIMSPFYGVIDNSEFKMNKRSENTPFWDTEFSWKEAN
jgi:hypothetical protein